MRVQVSLHAETHAFGVERLAVMKLDVAAQMKAHDAIVDSLPGQRQGRLDAAVGIKPDQPLESLLQGDIAFLREDIEGIESRRLMNIQAYGQLARLRDGCRGPPTRALTGTDGFYFAAMRVRAPIPPSWEIGASLWEESKKRSMVSMRMPIGGTASMSTLASITVGRREARASGSATSNSPGFSTRMARAPIAEAMAPMSKGCLNLEVLNFPLK